MSFSYNMVPSLPSMLSYLGLSQSEYNYALKHPDMFPALSLLEEGQRQCGIILENVALNDKIDPRLFVFLGKNYYGLQDKTDIQVSRGIDEVQISSDSVEVLKQQLSAEDNTTIIDTTPLYTYFILILNHHKHFSSVFILLSFFRSLKYP